MDIIFKILDLVIKAVFNWLDPWFDVEAYYKKFEQRIEMGGSAGWFWDWIFKKYDKLWFWKFKQPAVPRYRVLQKGIAVIFWLVAYWFYYQHVAEGLTIEYGYFWFLSVGTWYLIGQLFSILWIYFTMAFENLYYTISKTRDELLEYQIRNTDVYWLKHIFFAGHWLFKKEFRVSKFNWSLIIGEAGYYLYSIIILLIK